MPSYSLDPEIAVPPSDNKAPILDPAEVLTPPAPPELTIEDLGRALSTPVPQPLTSTDAARIFRGDVNINVQAPAPTNPDVARFIQDKLNYETTYNPATTMAPQGTNPRINYGPSPEPGHFSPLEAMAQPSLGILKGLAEVRQTGLGLAARVTGSDNLAQQARDAGNAAQQYENLGQEMSGPDIARHIGSAVPSLVVAAAGARVAGAGSLQLGASQAAAGRIAIGTMATEFGVPAADESYTQAQDAGYAHPGAYALASGLIAGLTALIPGAKGRNVLAAAAQATESQAWKSYIADLLTRYTGKGILSTHGAAGAIQGGIQATLQGILNKETIDPNTSWKDIVMNGLRSAVVGGIIGEGAGAIHQAEANNQMKDLLNDWVSSIDDSKLTGGEKVNPQETIYPGYQAPRSVDPRTDTGYSLRPPSSAPVEASSLEPAATPEVAPPVQPAPEPVVTAPAEPTVAPVVAAPTPEIARLTEQVRTLGAQPPTDPKQLAAWAQQLSGLVTRLEAAKEKVTGVNTGGSTADLPPEKAAISAQNNSRAAFEALAKEKGGTPLPTAEPVVASAPAPAALAEVTPAPAASTPQTVETPAGPHLPNKGEKIPLAAEYYITRDQRNKVVVRQEGNNNTLATLKTQDPSKLTKEALLGDVQKQATGQDTEAWYFNEKAKNNPLLSKGTAEARKEALYADPQAVADAVVAKLGDLPEQKVVKMAISTGAINPEMLVRLVGEKGEGGARRGPEVIAKSLTKLVKDGTKSYLSGKLLERSEKGQAGHKPLELLNEDGSPKSKNELEALYPDKEKLAARVLDILVKNREMDLEVEKDRAGEAGGLGKEHQNEISNEGDPNAINPVTKTGFSEDSGIQELDDKLLMTGGKLDPAKVKLAREAEEIRGKLLAGEDADYDKGVENLKRLGLKQTDAEHLMGSDRNFYAPDSIWGSLFPEKHIDDRGTIRTATEFHTPEEQEFYEKKGLTARNIAEPVRRIAKDGTSPYQALAKQIMQHVAELNVVRLGNVGGNGRSSHYSSYGNYVKIRLGLGSSLADEAVLHEAIHVLTLRRLEVLGPDSPEYLELGRIGQILHNSNFTEMASLDNKEAELIEYAAKNVHETLAMGLSNKETQARLTALKEGSTTLWEKFKQLIYKLVTGKTLGLANDLDKIWQSILSKPAVSHADWLAFRDSHGTNDAGYPDIRNLKGYAEVKDYQGDDLPVEENIIINRKAVANNEWVQAPDVAAILSKVPEESKPLLSSIIGARQKVIDMAKKGVGGGIPSSYQHIMADPSVSLDRKGEISLSVLNNVLQFKRQSKSLDTRLEKRFAAFQEIAEDLDKGIDESNAKIIATENAIKNIASDFKNRILLEKEKAVSDERVDQLKSMGRFVDQLRGGQTTAMSKYLNAVAEAIPLDVLLDETSPRNLEALVREEFPINSESAQRTGANEETQRMAAVMMANSNVLREQLLNLKLANDPKVRQATFDIDAALTTDLRKGDLNKALSQYTGQVAHYGTVLGQAQSVYSILFREKAKRTNTLRRLAQASIALQDVQKTPSFQALDHALTVDNQVTKPMKYLENTGQYTFIHPITRDTVTIDATVKHEAEAANLRKYMDLIDGAKAYLATPQMERYNEPEAAFWRNEVANGSFLLDPTVGLTARKLLPANYDPYQLVKLAGGLLQVPEHILQGVGGRAAVDAEASLQRISVIMSQLAHIKAKYDASVSLSADAAARDHGVSVDVWHREILNPLIASRQTTGYIPLHPGSTTIFGHEITALDEKAFQAQKTMDREMVEVATKGRGNPAVASNPSKITFTAPGGDTLTRKISTTGADTMSRRLGYWTDALAGQWFEDPGFEAKQKFLDNNLIPVLMGHMDTAGAPDYSVRSNQTDLYRDAVKQNARQPFDNTQQVLDYMFDRQHSIRDDDREISKPEMMNQLVKELDKVFSNVKKGFSGGEPKTEVGGLLKTVDTDNSFTSERGHLIAPTTFYEHGLTFDSNRIARIHSATAYYTLDLAGRNGKLDFLAKAIDKQIQEYETQLKQAARAGSTDAEAAKNLQKATVSKQLDGQALLTYNQALSARKQVNQLRREMERLLMNTGATTDPEALTAAQAMQSFISSNVLAGVQSRNKHLFGGLSNLMQVNKVLLGRSSILSGVQLAWRVVSQGTKELGAMSGPVGKMFGDVFEAKREQHRRMEELGLAPTANVLGDLKAIWEMPQSGGRPQRGNPSTTVKVMRTGESLMRAIGTPLSAATTRPVDRFLNILSSMKANDVEDMLRENAVKAGDARDNIGTRGVFTAPEIFGDKGASNKQEDMLRQMFHKNTLNLDTLMWNYRDAVTEAKSHGGDPNKVQFFTPEQRAAWQYTMAQAVSLPTFGNRPTGSRGTKLRNIAGLFWGFPAWQVSRYSQLLSRSSGDASTLKYVPTMITSAFTLAAMGATATIVNNTIKKHLYGENSTVTDLLDARDAKQASLAMASGFGAYLPFFVGSLINGVLLNNPNNTGFDINSQFVMLNFANDIFNTTKKMFQENNVVRPMEEFSRRWSPLTRIVVNRLPNETGITEYYNMARDLKNLAPEGMESKKRGSGPMDATPTTPIMQDIINAAYRNDQQSFFGSVDKFLIYQQSAGKTAQEAQQALQASFRAKNPYVLEFGRLPTDIEQAQIYANASGSQRAELDKAAQVFQTYGSLIGVNEPETKEKKEDSGGGGGGSVVVPSGNNNGQFLGSLRLGNGGGSDTGSGRLGQRGQDYMGAGGSLGGSGGGGGGFAGGSLAHGNGDTGSGDVKGSGGGGLGGGGGGLRMGGGGSGATRTKGAPRSGSGGHGALTLGGHGGSSLRAPSLKPAISSGGHKQRLSRVPYKPLRRDGTRLKRA